MVVHFKQSLKKLHEQNKDKQTQKDEITELQDAIIEIAEIVATVAEKEGEDNG